MRGDRGDHCGRERTGTTSAPAHQQHGTRSLRRSPAGRARATPHPQAHPPFRASPPDRPTPRRLSAGQQPVPGGLRERRSNRAEDSPTNPRLGGSTAGRITVRTRGRNSDVHPSCGAPAASEAASEEETPKRHGSKRDHRRAGTAGPEAVRPHSEPAGPWFAAGPAAVTTALTTRRPAVSDEDGSGSRARISDEQPRTRRSDLRAGQAARRPAAAIVPTARADSRPASCSQRTVSANVSSVGRPGRALASSATRAAHAHV